MNLPAKQTGIALAQALIFLLILTFIGLTAARNAALELHVSNNLQTTAATFQEAENCLATRLRDSINGACGTDSPPKCTAAEDAATQCCTLGNNPNPENTSVDLGLTEWYYEVNTNGCDDPPDDFDINPNAPAHRAGFAALGP